MLIPLYWAEARQQRIVNGRQWTIRRWGWSDESLSDAQLTAETRVEKAFGQVAEGVELPRRERKMAYNGAGGAPIREEVVARDGETIVTRNVYGALCLNTPDVMFVDIDVEDRPPSRWFYGWWLAGAVLILFSQGMFPSPWLAWLMAVLVPPLVVPVANQLLQRARGGARAIAMARIKRFSIRHPEWNLRVYETPLGFRLLAMHRTFDPHDDLVAGCFQELGCDPVYMRMCLHQRCFRARVSPKPWRMGMAEPLRPRRGVWPLPPEKLVIRQAWVREYDQRAVDYASCRFVVHLGCDQVHASAEAVRRWHDDLSRAESGLPIA